MKLIKNYIRIVLLNIFAIFCTYNAQSDSNNSISIFFSALDEFDSYYNKESGWEKEFSKSEIINISRKYYKAICKNPVEYSLYFDEAHKFWEGNGSINEDINYYSKRPGLKIGRLKRKIEEYTSPVFSDLLQIPYFLRVKVLKFERTNYHSLDAGNFPQTNVFAEIKDVIKGDTFCKGDTIIISFLNWWFQDSWEENSFKVDNEYFVLTRVWDIKNIDSYGYSVHAIGDQYNGVYLIDNDSVYTPNYYWGIGNKSNWSEFKEYITNNYILQ